MRLKTHCLNKGLLMCFNNYGGPFMIKISVIVPIYNRENYLHQCVDSILAQTYKNLEIILVDDGSTDDSACICDYYQNVDERIKVIHSGNEGVVSARKKGLEVASGDYIGFVDSDDYIEKDMYECLLNELISTEADLIYTGFYREYNNGRMWCSCEFMTKLYDVEKNRMDYLKNNFFDSSYTEYIDPSLCTKLFKSEVIKKCYFKLSDSVQYGEDRISLLRCCFESKKIYHLKKVFYHYRFNNNSMINTLDNALGREAELYQSLKNVLSEYGYEEKLKMQLETLLRRHILFALRKLNLNGVMIQQYQYASISLLYGKKCIIYGAGNVGVDYYKQLSQNKRCKVLAMVDSKAELRNYEFADVMPPQYLDETEYDYIVIAVLNETVMEEIKDDLIKRGIKREKILWEKPVRLF